MKVLLSWLSDYISLEGETPEKIAETLTKAGLEVDAVEKLAPPATGVVVCRVLEVEKHPEADKLSLATVTDGVDTFHVVCGASNCRKGLITALARIGAKTVDDQGKLFTIKKNKIRGVESQGMLCAKQELGLPDEGGKASGIIEFSPGTALGLDVAKMYSDVLLEISLTPNLGHCSSLIGVARELFAAGGKPLKLPKAALKEDCSQQASKLASIEVKAPKDCPRYACRLIKDVVIGPSPEWLKNRLEMSGVRSINNVVDVTNYVMLELGHPLHAFDYDHLQGHRVVVQNARELKKDHMSFVTLDGKTRQLEESDLLICDGERPIALAGIMGGADSEVKDSTKNILLEGAVFSPQVIRKTSKRLGLMTDASKRFERGCDPNIIELALARAASLITEVAGGKVCEGLLDQSVKKFSPKQIRVRISQVNRLLGTHLSSSEVEAIFQRLECSCTLAEEGILEVLVPTYRNDLQEEIDLVEEVARVYGFDNIGKCAEKATVSLLPHAPMFLLEREVRKRLLGAGLQEFLTCDLIGPTLLNTLQASELPEKAWIHVLNPVSVEQSILRTSLLPGLLQVVKYNWDHGVHNIAGFEIGQIHFKRQNDVHGQYCEQSMVGIILSGKSRPHHWDIKPSDADFYDLKGVIENLLQECYVPNFAFKKSALKVLHPGRQATIFSDELEIGSFGELHPSIARLLDVPHRIYFAEISLHDLQKVRRVQATMKEISTFPGSERDLTLTVKEEITIDQILQKFHQQPSKYLESIQLIDIYRSDKLGQGLKNVTFRFYYRDPKKTILQEKVDAEHARITESPELLSPELLSPGLFNSTITQS